MVVIGFVSSGCALNYVNRAVRRRQSFACARVAQEPLVPPTYEAMYKRAARAARLYLESNEIGTSRAAEVEFPPIIADDGSASARYRERESHARLAVAMAAEFGERAALVAFDELTLRMVRKEGGNATLWPQLGKGDVVVGVAPSAEEEWNFLENIAGERCVVVANGLFNNGLDWLEPVFYVRPCSGWGVLIREFPATWKAVSARTGGALSTQIALLTQGRIRRPDLPTASKALQKDYYLK